MNWYKNAKEGIGFSMKKARLLLALVSMAILLAGCGNRQLSTLHPAGEVADRQFFLLIFSLGIMFTVIFVVVSIYSIILFRFRRSKVGEDKIPKQVEGSHKLEIIWTSIPIILVIALAIPTVYYTFKLGDVRGMELVDEQGNKKSLVVKVTANQYWWHFEYPDLGIVTSQDLVVPTGERVYFELLASDVKHSFWVPAAGGKMDTNTDNVNRFYLEFDPERADEAGNLFFGKCAELCGPSHALMDFKVKAISKEEFEAWVESMQNYQEPELTSAVAIRGQELFMENNCFGCHAVTPEAGTSALAPNLADFGNRSTIAGIMPYTKENLKKWIKNPGKIKSGNKMYSNELPLSDEELDALAEYLMSLKAGQ